jgi:hypothetical protein
VTDMVLISEVTGEWKIEIQKSVLPSRNIGKLSQPSLWSLVHPERPPVAQLIKNFPAFYGTRRFITVFIRAIHQSLS